MPAPATIDDFLDVVRKSNQVDPARLEACLRAGQARGDLPEQPRKLAALLVREGLLTNFQAEQLLQGKYKGFTLAGYRLLERLGQGGTGTVYLAEHELMRRRVALKVMPANPADGPSVAERFLREAQAAAALDHPNIVRAYDFRQEGNVYLLVMEFIDGWSLHEVVARQGPLPAGQASEYIRQAALGLQHAHEAGLVHRDIKPANLLVDNNGLVKILDLGLARYAPQGAESVTRKFDDGMVMGTADYLAPEQALNLHDVDHRADIYSLGATFYALLTGEPPFHTGTVTQKLLWHQMREPKPLEKVVAGLPEGLPALVRRMMAKSPEDRFESCAELAQALEEYAQGPWPAQLPAPRSGTSSKTASNGGAGAPTSPSTPRSGQGTPRAAEPAVAPPPSSRKRLRAEEVIEESDRTERLGGSVAYGEKPLPSLVLPKRRRGTGFWVAVLLCSVLPVLLLLGGGAALVWYLIQGPTPTVEHTGNGGKEDPGSVVKPPDRPRVPLPNTVGQVASFLGHQGHVQRVAFSPDGQTLLSAGDDKTIRVWDIGTRSANGVWNGHGGPVTSITFGRDGRLALSASADGTARLWNVSSGRDIQRFMANPQRLGAAVFTDDDRQVITGGDDRSVRLWDAVTGKHLKEMKGHGGAIVGLALRPGKRQVVSASADKTARVWDLDRGTAGKTLTEKATGFTSVAASADGRLVLLGGQDGKLRLWEPDSGKPEQVFGGHAGGVGAVAVMGNGKHALSGGADKVICLWDLSGRKLVHEYKGHTGAVTGLALSPTSLHFASSSHDGSVRVWGLPPLR